jgi:hypothetical protein
VDEQEKFILFTRKHEHPRIGGRFGTNREN